MTNCNLRKNVFPFFSEKKFKFYSYFVHFLEVLISDVRLFEFFSVFFFRGISFGFEMI